MPRLGIYPVLLALAVAFTGCSQETQQKASDAMSQTGEALQSAAEDAKNITEGAVKGASEGIEENQAKPDTPE
jgi:PBP1b-binding outer membrane lipoprotein LpoB